jgi:hypothetical protein
MAMAMQVPLDAATVVHLVETAVLEEMGAVSGLQRCAE